LPNTNTKTTERDSHSLENILNPHGFHIALLRDLNVPGYDWVNGFPQVNSHYYTKNRFDIICKAACYFGLFRYNYPVLKNNLLDLLFSNYSDIRVSRSNIDFDPSDDYQPFLSIEMRLLFAS
jgi:hypothetical protein